MIRKVTLTLQATLKEAFCKGGFLELASSLNFTPDQVVAGMKVATDTQESYASDLAESCGVNVLSGPASFIVTNKNEVLLIVQGDNLKEENGIIHSALRDTLPEKINHPYLGAIETISGGRTRDDLERVTIEPDFLSIKRGPHRVEKF